MAPVPLRYVVSFSSQDERHPVDNILSGDQTKRWLSPAREKLGRLEAEFQLERSCSISHLDIGTIWTFSVQISVGRSSWPRSRDYVTLLPSATFMNPVECKTSQNRSGFKIRMFKTDDFSQDALGEKYDRLRVTLTQPFRKDIQFGLCFIKVVADDNGSAPSGEHQRNHSALHSERQTGQGRSSHTDMEISETSSSEIQKHFFGNRADSVRPSDPLKDSLLKLSRSGMEPVSPDRPQPTSALSALSRNARLVMAAKSKAPVFRLPPATGSGSGQQGPGQVARPTTTASSLSARKRKLLPSIDDEIQEFLRKLDTKRLNVETFTFADLRHKFEKVKCRKLTKEERKKFFPMAKDFVQKAFNDDENEDNATEVPSRVQPSQKPPLSTTRSPVIPKRTPKHTPKPNVLGHNSDTTTQALQQNTHTSTTIGRSSNVPGMNSHTPAHQSRMQNGYDGTTAGQSRPRVEERLQSKNSTNTNETFKQNFPASTTGGTNVPTSSESSSKDITRNSKTTLPEKFKLTPGKSCKTSSVHHMNDFSNIYNTVSKAAGKSGLNSTVNKNTNSSNTQNTDTTPDTTPERLRTPAKARTRTEPASPDTCGVWLTKGTPPPPLVGNRPSPKTDAGSSGGKVATPDGRGVATPGGNAIATPGGRGAVATPGGRAGVTLGGRTVATPGGRGAVATPGGRGAVATPGGRAGGTVATPGGRGVATPGGRTVATPGGRTVTTPGGRAVATPGGRAVATPGGRAVATPGGRSVATPGGRAVATPGGRAVATPGVNNEFRPREFKSSTSTTAASRIPSVGDIPHIRHIISQNTAGGFTRPVSLSRPVETEGVPCPLCNVRFPVYLIETHAATCSIVVSSDSSDSDDDNYLDTTTRDPYHEPDTVDMTSLGEDTPTGQCPMCNNYYPLSHLPQHADNCAWAGYE